ncbi:hypothetical protein C8Q73DRAFT_796390 [Cubamyces lactineus]|nr:hypothetical protein C8Q73DRAFT_796390 [Cubamyces lactineus]
MIRRPRRLPTNVQRSVDIPKLTATDSAFNVSRSGAVHLLAQTLEYDAEVPQANLSDNLAGRPTIGEDGHEGLNPVLPLGADQGLGEVGETADLVMWLEHEHGSNERKDDREGPTSAEVEASSASGRIMEECSQHVNSRQRLWSPTVSTH